MQDTILLELEEKTFHSIRCIADILDISPSIIKKNLPFITCNPNLPSGLFKDGYMKIINYSGQVKDRVIFHESGHFVHGLAQKYQEKHTHKSNLIPLTCKRIDSINFFEKATGELMAKLGEEFMGVDMQQRWNPDKEKHLPASERALQELFTNYKPLIDKYGEQPDMNIPEVKYAYQKINDAFSLREYYRQPKEANDFLQSFFKMYLGKRDLEAAAKEYFDCTNSFDSAIMANAKNLTKENNKNKTEELWFFLKGNIYAKSDAFRGWMDFMTVKDNSSNQISLNEQNYDYLYHWLGDDIGSRAFSLYEKNPNKAKDLIKEIMSVSTCFPYYFMKLHNDLAEEGFIKSRFSNE